MWANFLLLYYLYLYPLEEPWLLQVPSLMWSQKRWLDLWSVQRPRESYCCLTEDYFNVKNQVMLAFISFTAMKLLENLWAEPWIHLWENCLCWKSYFDKCVTGMNFVTVQFFPDAGTGGLQLHISSSLSGTFTFEKWSIYRTHFGCGRVQIDVLLVDDPYVTSPPPPISNGKNVAIAPQWSYRAVCGSHCSGLGGGRHWLRFHQVPWRSWFREAAVLDGDSAPSLAAASPPIFLIQSSSSLLSGDAPVHTLLPATSLPR